MAELNSSPNVSESEDEKVRTVIEKAGFSNPCKVACTLQGSLWTANNQVAAVVVKVTDKLLHETSMTRRVSTETKKRYAVKENILKEAHILMHLNKKKHFLPFIPIFHTMFQSNTKYYLVMEHCGQSLFAFTRRAHEWIIARKLSILEWLKVVRVIFQQMVHCVQFAHSKNICHFDVSLENFLIDDTAFVNLMENGDARSKRPSLTDCFTIKICDFGLAEHLTSDCSDYSSNKFVGKLGYRSPENSANQSFDARSNDIWCLGVCLFMLAVGSSPFVSTTKEDAAFNLIMSGNMSSLLHHWHREEYVNVDIVDAFRLLFQLESKRCSMQQLYAHHLMKR